MKKIVIAPDGFKESRSAFEVAVAMQAGVKKVWPLSETILLPVADGGHGTLETLVNNSDGCLMTTEVGDPIGRKIKAEWGALGDGKTAVIEIARASGLDLLSKSERNPQLTSTRGVGQLFKSALDEGFTEFIVGVGGSSTNDGGSGMIMELGVKLLDENGNSIGDGGSELSRLTSIDISNFDERVKKTSVTVACDVTNPLCGHHGASAIFGPQKGASPDMVIELDSALSNYSNVIEKYLGVNVSDYPGAGASGGIGAAFMAFFNAKLRIGADIILDFLDINSALNGADLVIVGEGQFDRSTVFNKAPVSVASRAKERGIPVIGIAGSLGVGFEEVHNHGIDSVFSLVNRPMSLNDALKNTDRLVEIATEEACRAINIGMKSS
jgi:glycerate kinase